MSEKKNTIVAIHLLNDFSGSPLVFTQALKGLQQSGHSVVIHTSGKKEGFLNSVDAPFVSFPYRFFPNTLMRLLAFTFSQVFLFFQLWRYRKKDVTFYINTILPFGAAIAGAMMGKKVIYHVHESYIRPAALKKFLRTVAAYTADTVLYVSDYLLREERIPGVNSQVVYNALPEEFVANAGEFSYQPGQTEKFRVLMVCSLKDYKGIPEFVALARRHPGLHFDLVLNAQPEDIELYFSREVIPANLTWYPVQKNLDPFYRAASLVVNLTNPGQCIETFGMTILEAMCYGVPVIAPPVGGPAEIVKGSVNGFTIDVRDEATLDFRLQYLAENPGFLSALSEGAKETSKQFSNRKFTESILKNF